ncbi:hypothetical protein EUTSA_v10009299mg [Eutrema salsugineum]|uniref:Uncharacterized protein n=1 Tax=Eutrema salsugineum TaxID=72664 RepID=V4MTE0_EUTSA|nr:uncharacterized protein LOC18993154 [Eutrema salsugineum]ESQ35061.1 hypothetical protein EUTSA_v10009299mg [Eutrema salsugineum]
MKFFGWMQNKLNAKQGNQNRTSISSACSHHVKQEPREEFSDWPHALLAIGTFGTTSNGVNENKSNNVCEEIEAEKNSISQFEQEEEPSSFDDIGDFTPEEVGKLQKELMKLLSRTKKRKSDVNRELMKNLPLDRFLNCPSSLEVERRISNALCAVVDSSEENKEEHMERTINAILGRCKEISIETKKKRDISKTSISYLFKKIFVCTDGFSISPSPSLRDTLQESRMEKLLKMMLHKKINNAQASSKPTSSTTKRNLEEKKQLSMKSEEEEETNERRSSSDGHKWVKTDSDFIVLEI